MKYNKAVTSDRSKSRKAHFSAHSERRRVIMSAPLSKELQKKYNVRSMSVRKGDTVRIVRGDETKKNGKDVKVTAVYRKKFCIHVADLTREKANGSAVNIPVHPSNVVITDLYMNGSRQAIINRKAAGKAGAVDTKLD